MIFKNQPKRWFIDNTIYFITFLTYKRKKILDISYISELLIKSLYFYNEKLINLIAYTILPEHIHLLLKISNKENISKFLRQYKSYTSKKIKQYFRESENRILQNDNNIKYVWQRGTMDHCIRNEKDFQNHLKYIFYNSKKHLGIAPKNFKLHNFMEFVTKNWFNINFCDFKIENKENFLLYE